MAECEARIEIDRALRRERAGVGRACVAAHDGKRVVRIGVARVERDRAGRGLRALASVGDIIVAPPISDDAGADSAEPGMRLRDIRIGCTRAAN